MNTLEVQGLTAHYGPAQVLHGIDLSIGRGQLVGLLGPNGAGKTTLLKAIAGTVVAHGEVRVDGASLLPQPAYRRTAFGVGHCPEGRRLFGELSVLTNLRLGAYSRSDRQETETDLERVFDLFPRLKERTSQTASTLSGGEQQMVAIGRALMARPKLLLLDEPSVGIAKRLKDMMFATIRRICDDGVTVLLVEQDVQATLAIADYSYVLESGQIAMSGTKEELSDDDSFRKAFFGI